MGIKELSQQFKHFLVDKEIDFSEDKEHNIISFKYNELSYLFVTQNDTGNYFRMILPRILAVGETERNEMLESLNEMNSNFKCVKSTIENNEVWMKVEQLVYSTQDVNTLFNSTLQLLESVILYLRNRIAEKQTTASED